MAGSHALREPPLILPDWAGKLPAEWNWHKLEEVCIEVVDCPHSTPELVEAGPYLMARTSDILTGVFRAHEARRVSEATYRERTRRAEPTCGDLLYSREGTYFGLSAEVPPDIKVCLGQRMVLLRPDPQKVQPTYLRYWLNSSRIQSHIHGQRDGSVAERLNLPTIRGLPVCIPSLDEQRAIAHALATLDDKIELNRRMNETLAAIARVLFKSWFVDFDPVRAKVEGRDSGLPKPLADLFPNRFEDSELGEIPKGWEPATIGDVCEVIDCLHSKKPKRRALGEPLLQLSNIRNDGLIDMTDNYWIDASDYKQWVSRMEASSGDCVITNVGRVGAVAQIPHEFRAGLGRNMTGVRCRVSFP
mgnify:FL=1